MSATATATATLNNEVGESIPAMTAHVGALCKSLES
jgi:hypothetical protein